MDFLCPPSNSSHAQAHTSPVLRPPPPICLGLPTPPPPPPPPDIYRFSPLSCRLPLPPPLPAPHTSSSAFSFGSPPPPPPPHLLLGAPPPPHPPTSSSAFSIGPPPPPLHPPGLPAFFPSFPSQRVGFGASAPSDGLLFGATRRPVCGFSAPSDGLLFGSALTPVSHSVEQQTQQMSWQPQLEVDCQVASFTRGYRHKGKKMRHTDTKGYQKYAEELHVTEGGSEQSSLTSVLGTVGSTAVSSLLHRYKGLSRPQRFLQMTNCGVGDSDVIEGSPERSEAPSPKTHNMLDDTEIQKDLIRFDSIPMGGSEPAADGSEYMFMAQKRFKQKAKTIQVRRRALTSSSMLQQPSE